jgi:hypothetical protein
MNRAFRLWLHQKLRYGENVDDFVRSVLSSQNIQRYWQDETIAAILQGDNLDEFLRLLKTHLFSENGELLKRFCFILRIACQTPDETLNSRPNKDESALVEPLFLKPYGQGWKAIIGFLYENKELLPETLRPHITAVLNEWSSVLNLHEELPESAHEVGLLALHLLTGFKEAYRDNGDRKKLLSIIIKAIPAIHDEFLELLETDVFTNGTGERSHRPHYIKEFCEMAFLGFEGVFFCKYAPDTLIKLAHSEWLIKKSRKGNRYQHRSNIGIDHYFRLHEHRYKFSPASGAKGPFQYLLRFHPRKGLDFILELLNIAAEEYAYSDLDAADRYSSPQRDLSEPVVESLTIQLNDGTKIQQYYSERLWAAYRDCSSGSYVPDLLECALMALENWLIEYIEYFESEQLEWLFDYILRSSNSVMSTAVLASVATGFPKKVGKSALPLLRTPELYRLDRSRIIHEGGGNEIDWHRSGFQRDALSQVYSEERRTAALRPWRREDLEMLVVRLQFSEWRDEALAAIDLLHISKPQDETMQFLLHRIDSRNYRPVEDKENKRIIFEPEGLEPDLKDIQQQAQERMQVQNRFSKLYLWAKKIFREPLETEYYATSHEALAEAKELFEELKAGAVSDLAAMFFGGIVTAAAVFVRDYSSELNKEDVLWCAKLIIQTVAANADTDNLTAIADSTDHDGAAAGASVLPILLDFAFEDNEKFNVKRLIAIALTHINENVRHRAAEGIRKHLWQRDPEFAQKCIIGTLEYARFELEQDNQFTKRRIYSLDGDAKEVEIAELQEKKDAFRTRFARGELSTNLKQISPRSHSSWHILSPCLIIPDGSREPSHIKLLSKMLNLFFEAEQEERKNQSDRDDRFRDDRSRINYEVRLSFTKRFSKYLFCLHNSKFEDYIEQLQMGCEISPRFVDYLLLCVAVEAERQGKKAVYWQLWKELSQKLQKIAIEVARNDSDYRWRDDRRMLIRSILKADIDWQKIDYETQDIAFGKDLLLEFVTKAGENPDVFEALSSLMYHFPSIFFELGVHILSKHQKEEGGTRLLSGVNTAFYLERAIQRFLQLDQTGSLPRSMHDSCFVLLNAIVETASSRAYYLREHLIRSRKIL